MAASTVHCPICKKKVAFGDPEFPFCSDRCRTIDLGNWASEKYVISSPLRPEGSDESDELEEFDDPIRGSSESIH